MQLDRPRPRRRARWPWLVAIVAALGLGGWALLREGVLVLPDVATVWTPSGASAPPERPPEAPPPSEPSPPPEGLPPLGDSDRPVEDEARALSAHPAFDGWLRSGSLLRRFVAAVDNVADGSSPRGQLAFLAPSQPFQTREDRGATFIDPASYGRYDLVADVVASLDAGACARLYATFRPLLDAAYRELGRTDRTFDQALSHAIDRLLAVPVNDGPVELTPLMTRNEFADPRLESFSPAEKHLLRMGPRNIRLVQDKLRQIESALGR